MQITLSRVVEAARQRKAAVTAEAGGYIILLAVQRLAAQPRRIEAESIQLTAAGEIFIEGGEPAQPGDAEAALRRLLATLVSLSHVAPPALRAAAERPATGSLAALEGEVTAALIPINHAASGRALARLFRETDKALRGSPSLSAAPAPASSREPSSTEPVLPAPASAPALVTVSAPEPQPSALGPFEAGSLEIEVEVEVAASDDPATVDASAASVDPASGVSAARSALAPASDAPQLIVEELDDLDVQALDSDEQESLAALASAPMEQPAAAAELASEAPARARAAQAPVVHDELAPGRSEAAILPLADMELEPPPQRSDLRELLNGFLAHTRCEEAMAANLRRMIGLEPWRSSGAGAGAKLGPPEPAQHAR